MKQLHFLPKIATIVAISSILFGCQTNSSGPNNLNGGFISIKGRKFIDESGREIILHGINLVNKNPAVNYLGSEGPQEFSEMRSWGFNCIRLGVIWDGLEPEPGKFDEAYLQGIDQRIRWAKENHLYIILDMHQDLFSVKFSDGAPEWATLTGGNPHVHNSPVWSDAYFNSPAVQVSFDNFWANNPAPDGVGIQEHYARAWAHVAERYARETGVIGYDLMNEPFIGSEGAKTQELMLEEGAKVFSGLEPSQKVSPEELAGKWMTAEGRSEILKLLSDVSVYSQVIDVTQPIYARFESTKLMSMYHRVATAIRQVDRNHILFLETTIASNMGVYSGLKPIVYQDGNRDPLQAYAPHGYDLVTDTKDISEANAGRVQFIFNRHVETALRLNMPMLVGEWGAYGFAKNTLSPAQIVVEQFEKSGSSDTYWAYETGIEKTDHFRALKRPYPERISGVLLSRRFNPAVGLFECSWEETPQITAPTRIYIPDWYSFSQKNIKILPSGGETEVQLAIKNSRNRFLVIPPTGRKLKRSLVLKLTRS